MDTKPILSEHWSIKLGSIDAIVTDLEDIDQCIFIIYSTQPGEVPLEAEFGVDFEQYLDLPVNSVKADLIREATLAIERWEPRAEIIEVRIEMESSSILKILTYYKIKDDVLAEIRQNEFLYNVRGAE